MELDAELSSDPECTTTQTASAEQCFDRAQGNNNLWTHGSVVPVAQDGEADQISLAATPQYHWSQWHMPEYPNAQYCQNIPTNQAEKTSSPAIYNPLFEVPTATFIDTRKQTNFPNFSHNNSLNHLSDTSSINIPKPSSVNLTRASPSSFVNFSSINLTHTSPSQNLSQISEYNSKRQVIYPFRMQGWSEQSYTDESSEGTVRLEGTFGRSASLDPPPTPAGDHILKPKPISREAEVLKKLETALFDGYLRIKTNLEERRKTYKNSRSFLRAYSLTEQGHARFIDTFGFVEHGLLPQVNDLKHLLQRLDLALSEQDFQVTNEDDCSKIWTKLEDVQDQVMNLDDALVDFEKDLNTMQNWILKFHMPACLAFYSQVKTMEDDPIVVPNRIDEKVDINCPIALVQEIGANTITARHSIIFYKSCASIMLIAVKDYLKAIPGGAFSVEQVAVWARMCSLSLEDIARGLTSICKISENFASAMP